MNFKFHEQVNHAISLSFIIYSLHPYLASQCLVYLEAFEKTLSSIKTSIFRTQRGCSVVAYSTKVESLC